MTQQDRMPQRSVCTAANHEPGVAFRRLDLAPGVDTYKRCVTTQSAPSNAGPVGPESFRGEAVQQRSEISAGAAWNCNTVASERGNDSVIIFLFRALEAAERRDDQHSADGLRLAIVVRLIGLRSETGTPVKSGIIGAKQRQVRSLQRWRLKRVVEYIDVHLSARITLSDLAAAAGLSRMHFASQFRMATGLRPHEFLLRRRVRRAEELLQSTTMSIVEIALAVGFQTQAHLTTIFKRFMGSTPGRWRATKQMPFTPSPRGSRPAEFTESVAE
jgi:AraC-like DNA-binding protein